MQASFSSGEISPLLHARVDLARYLTGLAELQNMIVLPQGGVTRRPGLENVRWTGEYIYKLIPFEFNSTDTALIAFGDNKIRIYGNISGELNLLATINSPYNSNDVQTLDYVQSGNVIFLVHRNYAPRMLTRKTLTNWTLSAISFKSGPYRDSVSYGATKPLTLTVSGGRRILTSEEDIFNSSLVGTLIKLEYPVEGKTETITSTSTNEGASSRRLEVKGTLNVITTGGDWKGIVSIKRSSDGGTTWVTVREYERIDTEAQGQWDFTISETDDNIIYQVSARHEGEKEITVNITVSGFLKSGTYRITAVNSSRSVDVVLVNDTGFIIDDGFSGQVSLWSIGSWGTDQGYPGTIAMYQDRLVLASTHAEPQTIWMSRTGEYTDFSVHDPIEDDDAITITLAGSSADRIHSITTTTDLLAFTNAGEWKIKGAGDSGAITPLALTAHQQTNIGSKNIKPLVIDGRVIMVQAQGEKIYTLGYDLNTDGYVGNELSILSSHIFEGKQIISIAYQRTPDSLIWVLLNDGTFASCTFNPEHEVIGWARHKSEFSAYSSFLCLPGLAQTELFVVSGASVFRMTSRRAGDYQDGGYSFESIARTLRLNINSESGSMFTNKKLISRVIVSTIRSGSAWAAPGGLNDKNNWERRRKINFDGQEYLTDSEIQLDNGFDEYASVQIRSIDAQPLTIAAITPIVNVGS